METTCVMCGRPVDINDTVELPNGPTCMSPCYEFLERMIEQSEDIEITIEYDDDQSDNY